MGETSGEGGQYKLKAYDMKCLNTYAQTNRSRGLQVFKNFNMVKMVVLFHAEKTTTLKFFLT